LFPGYQPKRSFISERYLHLSAVAVYFYLMGSLLHYFQSDILKNKEYENAQKLFEDCVAPN